MDCKHIRRRLSAYQDGELNESMREAVKGHLQQCEQCRLEYEKLVKVYQLLEMNDEPVPHAQFLMRLKAKLYREKSRKAFATLPEKWISRVLVPSTAIAGLMIGAILGLHLVKSLGVAQKDITQFSTQYLAEELLTDVPTNSITFAYNSAIDTDNLIGGNGHE